jgi:CheY-like chemotaxis protein
MMDQTSKPVITSEDLDAPAADEKSTAAVAPAQPPAEPTPQPTPQPTSQPKQPKTDDEVGGKKKILIVEDEKPLAKALEAKLTAAGFSAQAAFNGKEGVDAVAAEKFDLVLTDLLMPNMDGWDLLQSLKEMDDAPTVIVLSNLGQAEDLTKAKELGAKDFWIKADLSLAEIVSRVSEELK